MDKCIKIYRSCGLYENGNEYIMHDDQLKIAIDYNLPNGVKIIAQVDNGKSKDTLSVNKNELIIDQKYLIPCRLKIELSLITKEQVIRKIKVEDLIIKKLDDDLLGISQITEMENRINELNSQVEEVRDKLNFFIELWKEGI